jgi:hypothetical protein
LKKQSDDSRLKLKHWPWILLLAAGCRPATTVVSPAASPCRVPADSQLSRDTLRISFSEQENESSRLLLRLGGGTLVRVDCEGRVHPGLAWTWDRDDAGTTWTFTLDSLTSAQSVVDQWNLRRRGGLWPWDRILDVRATGTNLLTVRVDSGYSEVPIAFAQAGLSVTPLAHPATPVTAIRVHSNSFDERDLLERVPPAQVPAVDLLITRQPAVIDYARSKPDFRAIPLAWDRTYVLVTGSVDDGFPTDAGFGESLAREVAQGYARPAQGPYWFDGNPCSQDRGVPGIRRQDGRPQVVYLAGDETGRTLAERIVAVQKPSFRVVALPLGEFNASLATMESALYVLSLPRTPPLSCSARPTWLGWYEVTPLVDVRAHALLRPGLPALFVESDGTVSFERPLGLVPLPPSAP